MESDLKCNRLTCRKTLLDKAVVTTCSHIFCVDCANELFNSARLCPACETSLTEPDDVVVCSLHPTNDYKTSVLSGLSPSVIMEICSRALSFWQYQIHQENSFQQAVVRNVNDKNAQLQKQLENVIREANGEMNLLTNKVTELERDLELERRRVRELQDASRERDKEYQKLKAQHDKIKRKALLAPASLGPDRPFSGDQNRVRAGSGMSAGVVDIGAVANGMEVNGVQRTPIVNRRSNGPFTMQQNAAWPQIPPMQQPQGRHPQRQPFGVDRSFQANSVSDLSESGKEVESMLFNQGHHSSRRGIQTSWPAANATKSRSMQQRAFNPSTITAPRGFKSVISR